MTKMLFDTGIKLNDVMWFSANLSSMLSNLILWTCLILTSSMCIWALFLSLLLQNAMNSVLFNFIENVWISFGLIWARSNAMSKILYISHHTHLCHWQTWILLDVMSWIYHWCVRWIALTKFLKDIWGFNRKAHIQYTLYFNYGQDKQMFFSYILYIYTVMQNFKVIIR